MGELSLYVFIKYFPAQIETTEQQSQHGTCLFMQVLVQQKISTKNCAMIFWEGPPPGREWEKNIYRKEDLSEIYSSGKLPASFSVFPNISVCTTDLSRMSCSRIHERTISLRFLGSIILRVLRLEVSQYNVYITNQFQMLGGG